MDDDNDGTLDSEDAFPTDATATTDTDGDGISDAIDLMMMVTVLMMLKMPSHWTERKLQIMMEMV